MSTVIGGVGLFDDTAFAHFLRGPRASRLEAPRFCAVPLCMCF